jgi:hypothetical protein
MKQILMLLLFLAACVALAYNFYYLVKWATNKKKNVNKSATNVNWRLTLTSVFGVSDEEKYSYFLRCLGTGALFFVLSAAVFLLKD